MRIKYIIWNRDSSLVALLGKHTLVLANRNLEQQCSITETVRMTTTTTAPDLPGQTQEHAS